jgi:hypothetical protein
LDGPYAVFVVFDAGFELLQDVIVEFTLVLLLSADLLYIEAQQVKGVLELLGNQF